MSVSPGNSHLPEDALEVRSHERISKVPRALWDALPATREAPFLSWSFLESLETTGCVGGDTGWLPHHLTVWRAGKLVAAAPAYVKLHSDGEFVFDHGWAEGAMRAGLAYYPKLVVAVPFTPAVAPRLLVAEGQEQGLAALVLAEALKKLIQRNGLSSAHVLFPLDTEARALARAGLAHRLGLQFQWHNQGYASFDEFLARFSSKRRGMIKRERRAMAESGITLETLRGREITPELVDFAFDFYRATVDKFVWGRQYLTRGFFEELVSRIGDAVELVVARDGQRRIAGALNFAGPKVLYGRYWGALEERPFLHFNVCYYHSIEDAIARGIERFEPGAGGSHKVTRGFVPTVTHSVHYLANRSLDSAVRRFLALERDAVLKAAEDEARTWG